VLVLELVLVLVLVIVIDLVITAYLVRRAARGNLSEFEIAV